MKVYTVEAVERHKRPDEGLFGNTPGGWDEERTLVHVASSFELAVRFIQGPAQTWKFGEEPHDSFHWSVTENTVDDVEATSGRAVASFELDGTVVPALTRDDLLAGL